MNRAKRSRWLWTGTLIVGCSAVACGEDFVAGEGGSGPSEVPCNQDPWICPDGQTCWIDDDSDGFACLNSAAGVDGDPCQNYGGTPTCTDDHGCYQMDVNVDGVCLPYCSNADVAHACPDGRQCQPFTFNNRIIRMCLP